MDLIHRRDFFYSSLEVWKKWPSWLTFFKLRRTWSLHVVVLQRTALQNVQDLERIHCSPYIAPFAWWRCHCGLPKLPDADYRAPGESVGTKINCCAQGLNLIYTLCKEVICV